MGPLSCVRTHGAGTAAAGIAHAFPTRTARSDPESMRCCTPARVIPSRSATSVTDGSAGTWGVRAPVEVVGRLHRHRGDVQAGHQGPHRRDRLPQALGGQGQDQLTAAEGGAGQHGVEVGE